jgi:hypothetical protein
LPWLMPKPTSIEPGNTHLLTTGDACRSANDGGGFCLRVRNLSKQAKPTRG